MEYTEEKKKINNNRNKKRYKKVYLSSIVISLFVFIIFFERPFIVALYSNIYIHFGMLTILLIFLLLKPTKSGVIELGITSIDLVWVITIIILQIYIVSEGFLQYFSNFIMYFLGVTFLFLAKADIDKFKISFKIVKFSSILYAGMTVIQYLFTDFFNNTFYKTVPFLIKERAIELTTYGYYPGLGFALPSIAAGYMAVGIGLILVSIDYNNKKRKTADIMYIVLLLLGIFLTGKRSIFLWCIITMTITYYISSPKANKISRIIKILLIFMLTSITTYFIFTYFDSVEMFSRLVETIDGLIEGEDVTSSRTILYDGAWDIFKENPILGVGWQQYIVITSGWFGLRDLSVHNVYLQLLSETGIVGFLAVITALLYVLYNTYKILIKLVNDEEKYSPIWKIAIGFSFYTQLFFILYCLTENPFYNSVYILIYFYSISIINSFIFIYKQNDKLKP